MRTIGWIDATEKTDNKTPTKLQDDVYEIVYIFLVFRLILHYRYGTISKSTFNDYNIVFNV